MVMLITPLTASLYFPKSWLYFKIIQLHHPYLIHSLPLLVLTKATTGYSSFLSLTSRLFPTAAHFVHQYMSFQPYQWALVLLFILPIRKFRYRTHKPQSHPTSIHRFLWHLIFNHASKKKLRHTTAHGFIQYMTPEQFNITSHFTCSGCEYGQHSSVPPCRRTAASVSSFTMCSGILESMTATLLSGHKCLQITLDTDSKYAWAFHLCTKAEASRSPFHHTTNWSSIRK